MTVTIDELNALFDKTMQAWDSAQANPLDTDLFLHASHCQDEWEDLLTKFKEEQPQDAERVFIDLINRTVSVMDEV